MPKKSTITSKYLPTNLSELLALPSPEKSFPNNSQYNTIQDATFEFLCAWKKMHLEYDKLIKLSESYKCPNCGSKHQLSGRDLWFRKFTILGTYYDFLVRQLISLKEHEKKHDLPPGLNIPSYQNFLENFPEKTQHSDHAYGHLIISQYLRCLTSTYFTGLFKKMPYIPNFPIFEFERQAHDAIYSLQKYSTETSHPDMQFCVNRLTHGLLNLLQTTYSTGNIVFNKDHKPGLFSAIRPHELALLANRDARMIKLYGAKQVEKIFEKQLALLFQSYGYYVIATKIGLKTVDLICISSDPRELMTILVEAKTSKRPYILPTKDRRALIEYVKDVKKSLTSMPPLAFILITGPQPSSTLETKLNDLEAEIQTPVRYATAAKLAAIRECIPGPLPMDILRESILLSQTKILDNLDSKIMSKYQIRQQAHSQFVNSMLGEMNFNCQQC